MARQALKILVIESFAMVRDILTQYMSDAFPSAQVVSSANEPGVLSEVSEDMPDILILGIDSIHKDQIEAAQQLKQQSDHTKLIFLSMQSDATTVRRAFLADADAYVLRDDELGDLVDAVKAVQLDQVYLSPQLRGLVEINPKSKADLEPVGFESLTEKQLTVLALFATGLNTREIASRLKLQTKTLDRHRRQIQWSLGVDSIAELTRVAVYHGLVTLDGRLVERETTNPPASQVICEQGVEREATQQ